MSGKQTRINYKAFIGIGASFMGLGIVFMLAVNTVMGIALLAVGAGNLVIGLSAKNKNK